MATEIASLFNKGRFKAASTFAYLMFFFYMPLGMILCLVRVLLSFQFLLVISILPKSWLVRQLFVRMFLFLIGMFVSCGGTQHRKKNAKFLISNHISHFDAVVIDAIWPSKLSKKNKLPNTAASWIFDLESNDETTPLPTLMFPEETTTNGQKGLLKFNVSIVEDANDILQPIVLKVTRSWFCPINLNCLESSFWEDFFWSLYSPFTLYTICFLPVRESQQEADQIEEFVKSLQKDMAYVLDQEATNYTLGDKKELIKRILDEERRKEQQRLAMASSMSARHPSSKGGMGGNTGGFPPNTRQTKAQMDTLKMIEQIKSVLPQVPTRVIQKELDNGNNVDQSISRLLDGSVLYTPLSDDDQCKETKIIEDKKRAIIQKANAAAKVSASSITASWKDRQLSFQDKKAAMLDDARRKYLELHPEYN